MLGATGTVGQSFVRLLADHPWFELAVVAASERSVGRLYRDATQWLEGELPSAVASLAVVPCDPAAVDAPIVFSALDSAAAGEIEPAFARAGRLVLSNAKNFRMEADVPLVIPEVNASHLAALPVQRAQRGWSGAIVTNANCAATGAAIALAPLHAAFGIEQVFVTTLQAVSGAGYPGVPSLDILGNVIPFIGEEEEKIERELPKFSARGTARRSSRRRCGERADESRAGRTRAPGVSGGEAQTAPLSPTRSPCWAPGVVIRRSWPAERAGSGAGRHDAAFGPQPRRDAGAGTWHDRDGRSSPVRSDSRSAARRDGAQRDSRRRGRLGAQRRGAGGARPSGDRLRRR